MIYKIVILAFGFIVALLLYTEFVRVEPQPITHDKNKSYKDQVQDVKQVVQWLEKMARPEAALHTLVYRPWGSYQSLATGPGFQVKRIRVRAGASLSLQMHHKRAEHWVVIQGVATVTCDERVFDLHANQSTFIPLGSRHRLQNNTNEWVELVEVQTGTYLGEDDIVRFDDVYGRVPIPV